MQKRHAETAGSTTPVLQQREGKKTAERIQKYNTTLQTNKYHQNSNVKDQVSNSGAIKKADSANPIDETIVEEDENLITAYSATDSVTNIRSAGTGGSESAMTRLQVDAVDEKKKNAAIRKIHMSLYLTGIGFP